MKKLLALIAGLAMALSVLPALAEGGAPGPVVSGDYTYLVQDDGTARITKYGGDAEALEIPAELDGIAVTAMDGDAFYGRSDLARVTLPDSLTDIGGNPFVHCYALTDIVVSADHPTLEVIDGVLFSKPDRRLVCYPCTLTADAYVVPEGIQIIGDQAFRECDSLAEIVLPDGLTRIGDSAFFLCYGLTRMALPDSLTAIDRQAFAGCSGLAEIALPDGLTSIGDSAFSGCRGIGEIALPDSVGSIGNNPFVECDQLGQIVVSPDHPVLEVVDGVLFSKPDRRLVCYPRTLTSQAYAVPQGTEIIGTDAFRECPGLAEVALPDGLTRIDNWAFCNCYDLAQINLPDSLTDIGGYAFAGCKALTALALPDSLEHMGDRVFYGNDGIALTVSGDSYARQYCEENDLSYTVAD